MTTHWLPPEQLDEIALRICVPIGPSLTAALPSNSRKTLVQPDLLTMSVY